jgi:hypothetical protein
MAPTYFAESISADSPGFWGTPCYSFLYYIMGWCDTPEEKVRAIVNMGERCPRRYDVILMLDSLKNYELTALTQ